MATQSKPATEAQESTERRKGPAPAAGIVDTPAMREHRHALAALLGDAAKVRDNSARLAAQAREMFGAVNITETARHYAGLAVEIFAAQPKAVKDSRLWASAWGFQMSLLAVDIFGDQVGEEAARLRNRIGSDASKFSLVFFYCPDVLKPWAGGLYGTQPAQYPTLGAAYDIARSLKLRATPRKDNALAKMWAGIRSRFGSEEEIRRFAAIVARDVKSLEESREETPAPAVAQG